MVYLYSCRAARLNSTDDTRQILLPQKAPLPPSARRLKRALITHFGKDSARSLIKAIESQINKVKPYAIFLLATTHGKELAASLSARLGTKLATDCVEIKTVGEKQIIVRRPVYAGKALANLILEGSGPHVLSLRPNVFRGSGSDFSRTGDMELLDAKVPDSGLLVKVREIVREADNKIDITEARIIISGGLGMQKPENFKLLDLPEILFPFSKIFFSPITTIFALLVISSDNNLEINSGPIPEGSPNNIAILILF